MKSAVILCAIIAFTCVSIETLINYLEYLFSTHAPNENHTFFSLLNLQSTQVQAGILTDVLDGPLKRANDAIEGLITRAVNRVQTAMDRAQDDLDKVVKRANAWATDSTRAHSSLEEISKKVCILA